MNYNINDLIDSRFKVTGLCNDSGGMGQVLNVYDTWQELPDPLALKYCREISKDYIDRFVREVRLIESFRGNIKVASILHSNINNLPPYFVMPFYQKGDLTSITDLAKDSSQQEIVFNEMIDCIYELHSKGVFHRDIKPQNFLMNDFNLIVSDFGLGMESDSETRFTNTVTFWGTEGYLPPEFQNGGFKYADAAGDIFMLGKSFYALITNNNPQYLMNNCNIHPALYYVIERACHFDKNQRFQTLSDLKQALKMAYDVILDRGGAIVEVTQSISEIESMLTNYGKYNSIKVIDFINKLNLIEEDDKIRICTEISHKFIYILSGESLAVCVDDFLNIYSVMVKSYQYSWSFSETIAKQMKILFDSNYVHNTVKAKALELAVDSAYAMNRYAAMDICSDMIKSVNDENLGGFVVVVMQKYKNTFITNIEKSQCKSNSVRNILAAFERG